MYDLASLFLQERIFVFNIFRGIVSKIFRGTNIRIEEFLYCYHYRIEGVNIDKGTKFLIYRILFTYYRTAGLVLMSAIECSVVVLNALRAILGFDIEDF